MPPTDTDREEEEEEEKEWKGVEEEEEKEEEEEEKVEESESGIEPEVSSDEEPALSAVEAEVVCHVSKVIVVIQTITPEEQPITPEIKMKKPPAPKVVPATDAEMEPPLQPPFQPPFFNITEKPPSVTAVPKPVESVHSRSFDAEEEELWSKPLPKQKVERASSDREPKPRRSSVLQVKAAPKQPSRSPSPKLSEEDLERYVVEDGENIKKEMAAVRYRLSVDAQRNNLKLLNQADKNADISSKLYQLAKHTIKRSLNAADLRLSCLMRKYIAHKALMQVR